MAQGMNLASMFSRRVDERFYLASQAALALNQDYSFQGAPVGLYPQRDQPLRDALGTAEQRAGADDYQGSGVLLRD